MKIVDKYILREFIISFLWSMLGLLAIYIVVDIFEQISSYVDNKVPALVILQYYICQIPYLLGTLLSPIACLLGCVISIGNFSRLFELMSLRAGGLSLYRLLLPLFWAGIIISLAVFAINETIAPPLTYKSLVIQNRKIKKRTQKDYSPTQNIYYSAGSPDREKNKFYHIKFIDPKKGIIKGLTIYEFRADQTVKTRIEALNAKYEPPNWKIFNGSQYTFEPDAIVGADSPTVSPALAGRICGDICEKLKVISFDSLILNIRETPYDFVKEIKPEEAMGIIEFKNYINNLHRQGEDTSKDIVDLYLRIAFPFMNLMVILLGFPLASKVRTLGFVLGFAIALFSSFVYWGLAQVAKAFGHAGILYPLFAAFMPNIIFLIVGLTLFYKFRK